MRSSKKVVVSFLCAFLLLGACQSQDKQASKSDRSPQTNKSNSQSVAKNKASSASKESKIDASSQSSGSVGQQATETSSQGTTTSSTTTAPAGGQTSTNSGTDYDEVTRRSSNLDIQAIAAGDFSSMAGTWKDVEGHTFVFDNKGLVSEDSTIVFRSQDRAILTFDLRNKTSGSGAAFMIIQAGGSAPGGQTYGNDVIVAGHDVSAELKPFYHERDLAKVEGQGGVIVKSGTLDLLADTPVYAEPNKASGPVFTYPKGQVNWDDYLVDVNGDNWYSYLSHGGQRYYIAYSDVGR